MNKTWISTRNPLEKADFCTAVLQGIADDGGLYIPEDFSFRQIDLQPLSSDYQDTAVQVLDALIDDLDTDQITDLVHKAYDHRFDCDNVVNVSELGDDFLLELYHGPTAAFKDVALSLLPHLMAAASKKRDQPLKSLILTATSGDTGKAALEGFKDAENCELVVFFPDQLVSAVQKHQMVSSEGKNVHVCAIKGNFDDAQSAVKQCFNDRQLQKELMEKGYRMSSANSINIGRLVPQIVYYFVSYMTLLEKGKITENEKVDFVVPTGNFGDILAGYYAKQMGLPVGRLIIASNANNVLADFFQSGVYDRNRPLKKTTSPSMDILVSSNLERLLAHKSGQDGIQVREWMNSLNTTGKYSVPQSILNQLQADFGWGDCTDEQADAAMAETWTRYHRIIDPHTATAVHVAKQFTGHKKVILSTASPFKFSNDVLKACFNTEAEEWEAMEKLAELSKEPVHPRLAHLKEKPVLHTDCIRKQDIKEYVRQLMEVEK